MLSGLPEDVRIASMLLLSIAMVIASYFLFAKGED